jgi:hypothetical protein
MAPLIYPGGDYQETLNLGLATFGMDETIAQNFILLDAFAGSGGGSGTVTSFSSGNIDTIITSSVATPTTTPALTFTLNTQIANAVWAGPVSGGAAAPTFRALVAADLPSLGVQVASVVLTSADILAATTVQVVPAPAAGQIIVPVSIEAHYTFGSSSYTLTAGNSTLSLFYAGLDTALMTCATGFDSGGIITNTFSYSTTYIPNTASTFLTASNIEAKALVVAQSGTFTSGNGTVLVTVRYYIVNF